jgi:hypothetical protein
MEKENLITVYVGTSPEDMLTVLREHRVEQLLVVDQNYNLWDVISVKDIQARQMKCFVIMPFTKPYLTIFENSVSAILRDEFKIKVIKADDIFRPGALVNKIHDLIREASFLIADISEKNPNVYYEVGFASALAKPVVFITKDKTTVPFDVAHLPYIEYEYTPPGMDDFEKRLRSVTRDLLDTIRTRSLGPKPGP